MSNTETVRAAYAAFEVGDVPAVLSALADDIEWTEAEGFPLAGTYRGHDAVVQGVFMPLGEGYEGFTVKPESIIGEGDTVVSVGWYEGRYRATGKVARARFAHVWTLRDGKATHFEQIVDSATFNSALS
ncbi:MAG: nuclear transport factor 2 family protein [Ilumatobacteraceae bacterium]